MEKIVLLETATKVLEGVFLGEPIKDIAKGLNVSRSCVVKHLKRLEKYGLVKPHPCIWEVTKNGENYIDGRDTLG